MTANSEVHSNENNQTYASKKEIILRKINSSESFYDHITVQQHWEQFYANTTLFCNVMHFSLDAIMRSHGASNEVARDVITTQFHVAWWNEKLAD